MLFYFLRVLKEVRIELSMPFIRMTFSKGSNFTCEWFFVLYINIPCSFCCSSRKC